MGRFEKSIAVCGLEVGTIYSSNIVISDIYRVLLLIRHDAVWFSDIIPFSPHGSPMSWQGDNLYVIKKGN